MHEAGLARAVAAAILERGLDPGTVTVRVTGGHGDPEHVRDSLRAHLEPLLGASGAATIGIELAPTPRLCAGCAAVFSAVASTEPCPTCGGAGIVVPTPEQVELLVADGLVDGSADAEAVLAGVAG